MNELIGPGQDGGYLNFLKPKLKALEMCPQCLGKRLVTFFPGGLRECPTCKGIGCIEKKEKKMADFLGMSKNNPKVQNAIETALCELNYCGPSREFSIVKTKLHEALLWLKAAERGDGFDIFEAEIH